MWKEHPEYPGYIEVSDTGCVRSLTRISPKGRLLQGKLLKPSVTRDGHLRVGVTIGDKTWHRYVHVLILETFVGPRPTPEHDARHLNGDPSDNRLSNLAWGTRHQNRMDDLRNGANVQYLRTHCPLGHEYIWWNNYKKGYELGNGAGVRGCRACSNARSFARRKGLPFSSEVADYYYDRNRKAAEK